MTGIVGYAIHQIVHLVFDIRTKYKHERTINIDETCPWSRGGVRESCAGIIWYGVWLLFGKNTPYIKVIRINQKPIYIPNCYYRDRRVRDLMQSVPITTYFVSSNTAHGILDIILGDIVCQLLVTTGRWFSSVLGFLFQ
jgi:hypothetical protein